MRVVAAMTALFWRVLRRDRLSLVLSFVLPLVVGSVLVAIQTTFAVRVGIVEHRSAVGERVVANLRAAGVETASYPDEAALEAAVRRRDVVAGVVAPTEVRRDGTAATIRLIGVPGVELPSGARAAVAGAVDRVGAELRVGWSSDADASPADAMALGASLLSSRTPPAAAMRQPTERHRQAVMTAVIGALVLFTFMNALGGAGSFAMLRELGLLARLRSTAVRPGQIATGYVVALSSYTVVQAVLMVGAGRVLFGLEWVALPELALVVALVVGVASALATLVGTLLPSFETGTTVAGPVGFALGLLGGCLWPLEIVPPLLRRLAQFAPQYWAIEALTALEVTGEGWRGARSAVLVLVGAAAVLVPLAAQRVRRVAARA